MGNAHPPSQSCPGSVLRLLTYKALLLPQLPQEECSTPRRHGTPQSLVCSSLSKGHQAGYRIVLVWPFDSVCLRGEESMYRKHSMFLRLSRY